MEISVKELAELMTVVVNCYCADDELKGLRVENTELRAQLEAVTAERTAEANAKAPQGVHRQAGHAKTS